MVLIAYIQCPIFKFECLFSPEPSFPWVFLSFEKMGIHCAIVPFSLVLHSETMCQLITICPLSTFTKFPYSQRRKRGRLMGQWFVLGGLISQRWAVESLFLSPVYSSRSQFGTSWFFIRKH